MSNLQPNSALLSTPSARYAAHAARQNANVRPHRVTTSRKPQLYRDVIDALVEVCKEGQGQIGPARVRNGLWNQNATAEFIQDQHEINLFLARLSVNDREILARMLEHAFEGGVFEAVKALGAFEIEPFADGYEGEAYHDFIGRLSGEWPWPKS